MNDTTAYEGLDQERRTFKTFLVTAALTVVLFLAGIFFGIAVRTRDLLEEEFLVQARTHFNSIVMTRRWNAAHGGVYVEKTPGMESNPYLDNPDITATNGKVYTKKNPALMTREISEMMDKREGLLFHITSLTPLNPHNTADEFETEALKAFERGEKEVYRMTDDGTEAFFHYMAPLYVERSCLECHAKQGYREGEVRGGISVLLNTAYVQGKLKENFRLVVLLGVATTLLFLAVMYLLAVNLYRKLSRAREEIRLRSVTDGLTGVTNRRHGMHLFTGELERARRLEHSLACVLLDIDAFKMVNDRHGHLVGDEVLREIARTVEGMRRDYDILCRFGGEEFLLVLPETTIDEALKTAERIRQSIRDLRILHRDLTKPLAVTASFGVAALTETDRSVEDLIRRADQGMYHAKETGKDRVCAGHALPAASP